MSNFFCVRALSAAVASLLGAAACAQGTTALQTVTITGNPLGAAEAMAPSAELSGTELSLRAQSTLGETLDGLPGVSSTYFGPNASRPVIRGLDGDRIRVLQNSGASMDASSLSFDHAVPTDPLSIARVEVLRGPGALLYGGSAVGGVVNVIDNRIAREPLFDAQGGISGKADLGLASGNAERRGAVLLETGGQDPYLARRCLCTHHRRREGARGVGLLPNRQRGAGPTHLQLGQRRPGRRAGRHGVF